MVISNLYFTFIFRLGKGIELIQSVQIDTERKRSSVEDAGKRNLVKPTGTATEWSSHILTHVKSHIDFWEMDLGSNNWKFVPSHLIF